MIFKDKSAPCTSLIALMSLGIGEQEEVLVSCQGDDCQDALQAVLQTLGTAMAADAHGETPVPAPAAQGPVEDGVLPGVCAAPGLVCGPWCGLTPWSWRRIMASMHPSLNGKH